VATEARPTATLITPEQLIKHWQGHRALTRRVIEAFPEDKLFSFTIGGMRTFADLAKEFLRMAVPSLRGYITNQWSSDDPTVDLRTKADLLRAWDESTKEIDALWATMPPQRFQETAKAFGQWDGQVWALLWYVIENEIHHRGQGYVYLRALGVEPPPFYDRP
jgi:uncharacterized damage-inducible protein DinB